MRRIVAYTCLGVVLLCVIQTAMAAVSLGDVPGKYEHKNSIYQIRSTAAYSKGLIICISPVLKHYTLCNISRCV